jgi:hypothetical protein
MTTQKKKQQISINKKKKKKSNKLNKPQFQQGMFQSTSLPAKSKTKQ